MKRERASNHVDLKHILRLPSSVEAKTEPLLQNIIFLSPCFKFKLPFLAVPKFKYLSPVQYIKNNANNIFSPILYRRVIFNLSGCAHNLPLLLSF